jgi:putative SOS response-associated peptidase YedK
MCGRFDIHSALAILATVFSIDSGNIMIIPTPNYNVAPTNEVPVVVQQGSRRLISCRWGFVPAWAKDMSSSYKMINARAESLTGKSSFRKAFEQQRCLVVADGFYEWRKEGKVRKPMYIRLKSGEPFGMAGLYNVWHSPEGEDICTCTIITTDANELVRPVHDRMPVIAAKSDFDPWLDPRTGDFEKLKGILKPCAAETLEIYEVTPEVNSPKNNSPENIEPLKAPQ